MQPRQADEIETIERRQSTRMRGITAAVEDRRIEPAKVRREAYAPHDRAYFARLQIERAAFFRRRPYRFIARSRRGIDAILFDVRINPRVDAVEGLVRAVEILGQIRREMKHAVLQIPKPAIQFHALGRELAQINITAAITAGDVVIGIVADTFTQWMLIDGHVVILHVGEPVDHVAASVKARATRRFAYGEDYLATGQMQVFRDLRAGLPRSDHQHRALGQSLRVPIFRRLDLFDGTRQAFRHARHDGRVITARRDHDLIRRELPLAGGHAEAAFGVTRDPLHFHVFDYGGIDGANEAIEILDDLVFLHEAVRIVARIGVAGQRTLPVRCDEAERVPALRAPRVRHRIFLEHEMIDPGLFQEIADRQSRLTAAHYDDAGMRRVARCLRHDSSFRKKSGAQTSAMTRTFASGSPRKRSASTSILAS